MDENETSDPEWQRRFERHKAALAARGLENVLVLDTTREEADWLRVVRRRRAAGRSDPPNHERGGVSGGR